MAKNNLGYIDIGVGELIPVVNFRQFALKHNIGNLTGLINSEIYTLKNYPDKELFVIIDALKVELILLNSFPVSKQTHRVDIKRLERQKNLTKKAIAICQQKLKDPHTAELSKLLD